MIPRMRARRLGGRSRLIAGLAFSLFCANAAETLSVTYDGEYLRPTGPDVHFLAGKSMNRLKDGETFTFYSWLSLYTVNHAEPMRVATGRFVVSYDIWEEKFKVTIPGAAQRSRTGLTAYQAEAWCLENMPIRAAGLNPDTQFYVKLELRGERQKAKDASEADSPTGISIRAWIELFSRKAGPDEPHWGPYESARQRLSDLVRSAGRGPRSG
jgi:hypothetical protein